MTTSPVRLTYPLRQKWRFVQGFAPLIPAVSSGSVFIRTRAGSRILDEATGGLHHRVLRGTPLIATEAGVVLASEDGVSILAGPDDEGRALGPGASTYPVVAGGLLVSEGATLRAKNLATGDVVWELPGDDWSDALGAGEDSVVLGLMNGDVVCLDLATGRERWRHSVADLQWFSIYQKCFPTGAMEIAGDRVIVQCRWRYVVCLDLRSGRRLWTYGPAGYSGAGLYRDRYYVVGQPLVALDPTTGQVLQESKREDPADRPEGGGIDGPIAISETHVFCATSWGPIVAWERTTGKLAGLVKGEGAIGVAPVSRYMLIKNGRLYYGDRSWSVFCFEEETPTDPVLKKQRAEARALGLGEGVISAGVLDFSREKAPTRAPARAKRDSPKRSAKALPRKTTATRLSGKKALAGARRGKA